MEDGKITNHILDNLDNTDFSDKPPYWILVGFSLSLVASITGSIGFILISFFVGCFVGIMFSYIKSRRFWKYWPYWLKGGIIVAMFALVFSSLNISCLYFFTRPDSWGFECLPFAIPQVPFWFIPNFISLQIYEGAVIVIWFAVGSILGLVFGHVKSRKSNVK
jgi:hypothetical protein